MQCAHPLLWDGNNKKIIGAYCPEKYDNMPPGFKLVPCGQCLQCRMRYARDWACRCMMEAETSERQSWFITLTYDDMCLPERHRIDTDTGEILQTGYSVCKEDIQKYHKRLREHAARELGQENIKFFTAAEYGDRTMRPHYHEAIFNLDIPDLKPVGKNEYSCVYYTSEWLEKIWNKGHITIGLLEWDSAAYIGKYMTKKQKGQQAAVYEWQCIESPWSVVSNGVGREYYEQHKQQIYQSDTIVVRGRTHAKVCKPPRIFDKWFEEEEPATIAAIKERRANSGNEAMLTAKELNSCKLGEQFLQAEERARKKSKGRSKI